MAKTIGKDKGSLTRARRVSGAETEPVGDPSNDEPRDEDSDVALRARDSVARQPAPTIGRGGGRHAPAWMHNNGATRFIAESIDELFKVTWPTPQDAWNMTLVVVVTSAIVAVILGAADAGLIRVLEWVVSLSQPATPTH